MEIDIEEILRRYRDREIDLRQLREWLDNEGARVEVQIPRGQLLKLKRGGEAQCNEAIAQLLPACEYCRGTGSPKQFVSRQEYQQYSQRRDAAVTSGTLAEIAPPHFDSDAPGSAGSAVYYRCTRCYSIWVFVESERVENGSWNRVI